MAFTLTPADGFPPEGGEGLPRFLELQDQGVAINTRAVRTINVVADPELVRMTRGIGSQSHVVTLEFLEQRLALAPEVLALLGQLSISGNLSIASGGTTIGWLEPVTEISGTAAQANTGSGSYVFGLDPIINTSIFAGVVGYSSGTVTWVPVWTPSGSDPSPDVITHPGGIVEIDWPVVGVDSPPNTSQGLLTLTASIDGGPSSNVIEVTASDGFYFTIAWGPQP